jgi:hypothetical protein
MDRVTEVLQQVFKTSPQYPELEYVRVVKRCTAKAGTNGQVCLDVERDVSDSKTLLGVANVNLHGSHWTSSKLVITSLACATIYRRLGQSSYLMLDNGCCIYVSKYDQCPLLAIEGDVDSVTYDVVEIDVDKVARQDVQVVQKYICH